MRLLALLLVLSVSSAGAAEHAILVLGSSVKPDGRPSTGLARRLVTARALALHDRDAVIVVSGGPRGGRWRPEGEVMSRWLVAHGVPKGRIRVEAAATNTAENADLSAPILEREHVQRVTVVTERFHMRRALFHVRAAVGDRMAIAGEAAPDGLVGRARRQRDSEETQKIERDRAFRAAR